jgi:hypothetical protein
MGPRLRLLGNGASSTRAVSAASINTATATEARIKARFKRFVAFGRLRISSCVAL